MAKLPIYEQQTRAQSPQATTESMGGAMGRATQEFGGTLAEIGMAMQRRENTIDRVQKLNVFDQEAITSLEAIQADKSISSKAAVDKYQQALRQRADQLVEQHSGSGDSRANLRAQLENQIGQYTKSALGAQIKAQHQLIGDSIGKAANSLAIMAGMAPDQYINALSQFDTDLQQFEGSIPVDMLDQYRKSGRTQIATNAVNSLIQRGQLSAAKSLMSDPTIGPLLTPEAGRQFSMNIAVGEYENEKESTRINSNISKFTMILGRDLTAEEQIKVRMLPDKKNMTAADEIMQLELIKGRPASPGEVNNVLGVKGMYGESAEGLARERVVTNATRYANGLMSPEERSVFEADYIEAYKPIEKQDPQTGLWTKITPAVPRHIQQLFQRGQSFGAPAPRPAPQPTAFTGVTAAPAPAPAAPAGGAAPATSTVRPAAPTVAGQPTDGTIWSRRENITGVVPAAAELAGKVPVLGDVMGGGGQYATDRQYAEAQGRELIRALSQSGRYTAAEMQAIEKEVTIAGQTFDTPAAYAQRLIGIDEALMKRAEDAKRDVSNPTISIDKRRAANDIIATITNFRQSLGVPPRVKTPEEARKLGPGKEFIDPNGIIRVVPAE